MKPKTCKCCKAKFTPARPLQAACGPVCALAIAKQAREKKYRKEVKEKLEKLQTRSDLLKKAQTAINAWVRVRDENEPCISCGRHHQGQYHAGHFRSVGSCPELRFEPLNVWKQCQPCNTHLSGNLIEYRKNLVKKLGIEKVEWLEGPHEAKKYSREDLIELAREYRKKLKQKEKP